MIIMARLVEAEVPSVRKMRRRMYADEPDGCILSIRPVRADDDRDRDNPTMTLV